MMGEHDAGYEHMRLKALAVTGELQEENEWLKAENAKLRNDADLLRAMLSQKRLEKQCYMAENAELQETLQRRTKQFEGMAEMWVERGVENYKLRGLVKRMFDRVNCECRCCSVFCSDWDKGNECCVFTTLMRELGVVE